LVKRPLAASRITIDIANHGLLDVLVLDFGILQRLGDSLLGHLRVVEILAAARLFKL
jgi:hypothetical protein